MGKSILEGIRVVDLTMGWAGPLATMILGGMGAEVIKVEACQRMDWWRGRAGWRGPDDISYEQSPNFNSTNLYKYGITLNLLDSRGRDLFKRLVKLSMVAI